MSNIPAYATRILGAIAELKTTVDGMSSRMDGMAQDIYRLDVLYEDLDERFKTDSQFLHENLKMKDQVDAHELRLADLENKRLYSDWR